MTAIPQTALGPAQTTKHPVTAAEFPGRTPFHRIQWARGWRQVTTEKVTGYRLLRWPHSRCEYILPYYRIASSPLWTALEGDAQLPQPVWQAPVTYAGSLYAEYGGIPQAPRSVIIEAVDRGRRLARHWGTAALVVTNLVSADALRWAAAQPPDARIGLYWAHRIPVPDDVDAWVAGDAARKKSRRELRRLWNRGTEAGLRLRILHGPQMEPLLPEITRLARETSERHGPPLYGLEMFQAASEVPGAVAIVADHPQGIAGAFIAFRGSSTLYLWAAAIDQARRRALNTYGWLAYSSIAHACATTGVDWVDFGRGNYRYKSQLGLKRHALTCLVYLTRPDPALCRRLEVMHQGLHRHAHREWTRAHATTT